MVGGAGERVCVASTWFEEVLDEATPVGPASRATPEERGDEDEEENGKEDGEDGGEEGPAVLESGFSVLPPDSETGLIVEEGRDRAATSFPILVPGAASLVPVEEESSAVVFSSPPTVPESAGCSDKPMTSSSFVSSRSVSLSSFFRSAHIFSALTSTSTQAFHPICRAIWEGVCRGQDVAGIVGSAPACTRRSRTWRCPVPAASYRAVQPNLRSEKEGECVD